MHISYAQLLARRVELTAVEAATLVNAAVATADRKQRPPLPPAELIVLHADGAITFADADASRTSDPVRALAALLYGLLRLDANGERPRVAGIPGALVLMLARARGEIDLPAPSLQEFRDLLTRVSSTDRSMLAAIHARATRADCHGRVMTTPGVVEPSVARVISLDRPPEPRRIWFVPAAAFAAGCAVAVTFVVATGWSPGRAAATPAAAISEAKASPYSGPHDSEANASPYSGPRAAATPGATDAPVPERRSAVVDRHDVASGLAAAASPTTGQLLDHGATPLLARTLLTDAFSPSFAADGEVVFHLGRTDGRVMKASFARNGAVSVTPLVDDAAANYHGALSPDETRLAFDSDRDGIRGIYVAAGDGSSPRRVSGGRFATTPSWSPDGQRLAFVRAEPGHPRVWNVWIADLQTGRLTRVSHHRVGQAWRPSWFPDGQRLVYSVEDDLVVADLARQTSRSIRSPEPGRLVRTPAVSPDGRRVVFQVRGDGVWLFDVTSGSMRRVLADPTAEEFAWSPDGTRIAFHARRVGHWSLWQLSL